MNFSFVPRMEPRLSYASVRWRVWSFEGDSWRSAPAAMPEGAAASYAEREQRLAAAICMEAVEVDSFGLLATLPSMPR